MLMRLEPTTRLSLDKHSNTEPLCSRMTDHVNELYHVTKNNMTKMLMNFKWCLNMLMNDWLNMLMIKYNVTENVNELYIVTEHVNE